MVVTTGNYSPFKCATDKKLPLSNEALVSDVMSLCQVMILFCLLSVLNILYI